MRTMGYYKQSRYRGDFYRGARGDFYRGARGDFLDDLLSGAGSVLGGAVGKLLPAAFGSSPIAATVPGSTGTPATIPQMTQTFKGVSVGGANGVQIGSTSRSQILQSTLRAAGIHKHHRRMNPLNPRALRRAISRAEHFKKFAARTLKLVHDKRHVAGFKKKHRKG